MLKINISVFRRTRHRYRTTHFPSIGFSVARSGEDVVTDIVNDASCLPQKDVLGASGAAALARGLVSFTNLGILEMDPTVVHAGTRDEGDAFLCGTLGQG